MSKEHFLRHVEKSALHHSDMALRHHKLSKSHSAIADHTEDSHIAEMHRDAAAHHRAIAGHHQERQEDFEALREALANASGATVFDEHSRGGDVARANEAELLKTIFGE